VLSWYLDILEELEFVSKENVKSGRGGFAPMTLTISITKKGDSLLYLIEGQEEEAVD
jgi:hypothetical protein